MDYFTSLEIAKKWGISSRRVTILCNEGRIAGAIMKSGVWLIPCNASKPVEKQRGRKKQAALQVKILNC